MPACTVTCRSSGASATIRFMPDRSSVMPPCTGSSCPSMDEPAPQGMIGQPCSRHRLTTSTTSCVLSANTTPSGGVSGKGDSSRPWCSRTACAVENRLPKRCCRALARAGVRRGEGEWVAAVAFAVFAAGDSVSCMMFFRWAGGHSRACSGPIRACTGGWRGLWQRDGAAGTRLTRPHAITEHAAADMDHTCTRQVQMRRNQNAPDTTAEPAAPASPTARRYRPARHCIARPQRPPPALPSVAAVPRRAHSPDAPPVIPRPAPAPSIRVNT